MIKFTWSSSYDYINNNTLILKENKQNEVGNII